MSEPQPSRPPRRRLICAYLTIGLLVVATVSNWTWAKLPDAPPPPAGSKFATVDGTKIHYVETAGREPAVVMVHGLPGSWGDFDRVAEQLQGRRTIRISRPGYAYSSAGYVPFEQQVSLLHGLSEQLELKDPVIAGHSYGGAIALRYATRYADDVSGVVAIAPAVDPDGGSAATAIQARIIQASQLPVIEQLMDLTVTDLFRGYSVRSGGNEAYGPNARRDEAWLDRSLAITTRDQDLEAYAREQLDAAAALKQLRAGLESTRAPVWVLQGEDDALVVAAGVQEAVAELPGARLELLPGGHMLTDAYPAEIAAAIETAAR